MKTPRSPRALTQAATARRRLAFSFALAAALGLALLLDVGMGETEVARTITPGVVARVILHHLPAVGSRFPIPAATLGADRIDAIVWQIRLPHAIGGALVGTLLALAGVAFQSLLMNPL